MKYFIVIFITFFSNYYAQDTISYKITHEDIESVSMYFFDDGYQLEINLTDSISHKFYELTKKNIGKYLVVIYNDKILVEASVRAGIGSGTIAVSNFDRNSVCVFFKELVNNKIKKNKDSNQLNNTEEEKNEDN